jgi:glutathione S-transferase
MRLDPTDIRTREVLEWQGLHLLHFAMSSCSQKVRILMGELGIDYVSHPVNLMRDEQQSDWFLGINPRGLVPVLVHDGEVHTESNDIIEYLDRQFAKEGSSLLPTSEAEQALMRELMDLEDELHGDLRTVTFTYLAPDSGDRTAQETGDELGYIRRFDEAFKRLDARLQDHPYLLGDRMTLADISWFITLYRLDLAGFPMQHYPALKTYFDQISRRPTFRKELAAGPLLMRLGAGAYRRVNRLFKHSLPKDYERWRRAS